MAKYPVICQEFDRYLCPLWFFFACVKLLSVIQYVISLTGRKNPQNAWIYREWLADDTDIHVCRWFEWWV